MVVPLFVGRDKSVKALESVMKGDKKIMLITQKSASVDDPKKNDLFDFGTVANVLQLLKLPDGTVKVLVEGLNRASINVFFENEEFLQADVDQIIETIDSSDKQLRAMSKSTTDEFDKYVNLDSDVNYLGKEKLKIIKSEGIKKKLMGLIIDANEILINCNKKICLKH